MILNSETLTGAHPSILEGAANNFGETFVGRMPHGPTDSRNAGATQYNRNVSFICLTDRLGREATFCFHPHAGPSRPHNPTMPIFPRNQPMAAHDIGSPGRRREGRAAKQGDRIWEFVFFLTSAHLTTDEDNRRELAETLLDCLLPWPRSH